HHGHLPSLAATGPASHAGVYAVLLRDLGLWGESLKLGCPPTAQRLPPTMAEIQQHEEDEQAYWQNFAGNYAYSLGYLEKVHGKLINKTLKRSDGDSLPILADRPPRFGEVPQWATANSPNHSGRGQNVLQLGGNVQFLAYRSSPTGEDHDIFRNHNNQQNAGLKLQDIVLGASEARPLPTFISMD
ncbi:MAG TPA: hypothetical protein PKD72_01755, partial [Gemmatales bacterium]|nr:hypothetical protein [Gemmatales bacterium]